MGKLNQPKQPNRIEPIKIRMRFIVGFVFAVLLLSQCAAAPMRWRHKKSYNRHRDVRKYQMARAARAIYQAAIANHTMSDSANNSISDINLKVKVGSKDIEVDRNDGTVLQKVPRTDTIRRQRIQEANELKNKVAELAPTTSAPTTAGAAGSAKSGNATAAATSAPVSSKAVTNASVPVTKKPIKVNLSFEIEPAELEAGQQ